jgi:hypothetical protein
VINTAQTDPTSFYTGVRGASLSKFEPKNTRYTAAHVLDLYSEVASICRPPLTLAPNEVGSIKKTTTPTTGYIISVYKVRRAPTLNQINNAAEQENGIHVQTGSSMLFNLLNQAVCSEINHDQKAFIFSVPFPHTYTETQAVNRNYL